MPVTLDRIGERVAAADLHVAQVISDYHPGLRDAGVTVTVLMAHPPVDEGGDPTGPAVTCDGYPCEAKVQVTPYRYRVLGVADAQITIDADIWDTLTDRQRDGLIDHEATHLELAIDRNGIARRDDENRPVLKIRKHDRLIGAFDAVASRHGESSLEWRQWQDFEEGRAQRWLFDCEPDEEDEEAETLSMAGTR